MSKPNCYECIHRGDLPGNAHSHCNNILGVGVMEANTYGVKMGWFLWPYNFDPVWLIKCDGFTPKPKKETKK